MKRISHKRFICFIAFLLLLLTGCQKKEKLLQKSGFYFDTIITITLYDTAYQDELEHCFEMAKEYENLFSNRIATSDVSKINRSGGEFVAVDPRVIELLNYGIEYGKKSNGAFDITLGSLSELWNISEAAKLPDSSDYQLPTADDIQTALSSVDYSNIEIQGNLVRLKSPNSKLDLGAIAKGYIADQLKAYLLSCKVPNGIISLGGNVLVLGSKKNDAPFTVGIQKPFGKRNEIISKIQVKDKSVVSSGIYERYVKVDSKIYHHLLDLSTGYPIENNLYEVTIISDKSVDGDFYSTYCFLLGREEGLKFINSTEGIEGIFIDDNDQMYLSDGLEIKNDTIIMK